MFLHVNSVPSSSLLAGSSLAWAASSASKPPPGARAAQLSSADLHLDGILTVSVWFPRTLDSSAENRDVASSRCSGSGTRTRSCKALVSGSLFPSREVTHARSRV